MNERLRGFGRVGALACALLAMVACSTERTPRVAEPTHIVLISLDTLRRDHVGAYRPAGTSFTPAVDELAAASVVFDRAYAPMAFTLPSHMSMFTSLQPDVHQVDDRTARLGDGISTLPLQLQARGFSTIGIVTNSWMKGAFGFDRGFDHYERLGVGLRYSDRVIARTFELLDEADRRSQTFLFLHFLDPHSDRHGIDDNTLPYYSPAEFRPDPGAATDDPRYCDAEGHCATRFLVAADQEAREFDAATLERISALYRAGIEYLDHDLLTLFEGLRARGLWDSALVIVTSDHGEEFREHGRFLHVQPYVENLAVPLIVKLPGNALAGTRVGQVVQSIDLMPTILDLLGEDLEGVDRLPLQGRSLLPLMHGLEQAGAPALGSDRRNRDKYALRTNDYSFVYDFSLEHGELFDLLRDPEETSDVSAEQPETGVSMLAALVAMREANRRASEQLASGSMGESVLSVEEQEQLRALGYAE